MEALFAMCVQHEKPFGGMMHKSVPLKAITPIPLGLNTDSIAKDRRKRTAIYRMERSEFSSCITMRNGSGVSSSELLRRKACEEIGVKKRDYAAFHRSHINKVMAIAFVAAVFDGSLESGCEVVKLPLVRAQAPKIAGASSARSSITA